LWTKEFVKAYLWLFRS